MVFAGYLVFLMGQLSNKTDTHASITTISTEKEEEIAFLSEELSNKNALIISKQDEISDLQTKEHNLNNEVSSLQGKVKGLSIQNQNSNNSYPFAIPTNGFLGDFAGGYGGNMYGMRHFGVDIWTSMENSGSLPNHKGNPVYSACNGVVDNIDSPNGGLTIKCDPIPDHFNVPNRQVYTYYGHMGHAESKRMYNVVGPGSRVEKGQKIGSQGDLSSYFPEMRNVHLHFSIFAGLSETDKKYGAYNPCIYIGGDCMTRGEEFKH